MDEDTTETVLRVQIQDLQDILAERQVEGKGVVDHPSTEEATLMLVIAEFRQTLCSITDKRMAQGMTRAMQGDEAAILAHVVEENRSSLDRNLALELSGQSDAAYATLPKYDENSSVRYNETSRQPSSSLDAKKLQPHPEISGTCVACYKDELKVIETPCKHLYCYDCISRLFVDSLKDETLFPARCCKNPIPLDLIRHLLTDDIIRSIEFKVVEHETTNRTYCAERGCAKFIPLKRIVDTTAFCTTCYHFTCTRCKAPMHAGECKNDGEMARFLRIAENSGWKRCYKCLAMVELGTGCNHITCRCGAEFCYTCSTKWKNCQCALWDEARLLGEANAIVGLGGVGRAGRVAQVAQQLRERHECDHEYNWTTRGGAHRCELCRNRVPNFILQCPGCGLQACVACRNNRA